MSTKGTTMERLRNFVWGKACRAHLADPRRFDIGPAKTSIWGWLYFSVLADHSVRIP